MSSLGHMHPRAAVGALLALGLTLGGPATAGAVSSLADSATPFIGAIEYRSGFYGWQYALRPFDTANDLASQGNGALAAVAKDNISGYPLIHQPQFANDGYYGNGTSWIADSAGSWLKVDLGKLATVHNVRFGRDRLGFFGDRDPGQFKVLVATTDDVYANGNGSNDSSEYDVVFDSSDHGYNGLIDGAETVRAQFDAVVARYVMIRVTYAGTAIDELEVAGTPAYTAQVLPPIKADGLTVFKAQRGVIPVKFSLGADGSPVTELPSATIEIVRLGPDGPQTVEAVDYAQASHDATSFRISEGKYVYNLSVGGLGPGSYEVRINVDGLVVGTAHFTLA